MISETALSGWTLFWIIWFTVWIPFWIYTAYTWMKQINQKEAEAKATQTRLQALEKELLNKD